MDQTARRKILATTKKVDLIDHILSLEKIIVSISIQDLCFGTNDLVVIHIGKKGSGLEYTYEITKKEC